MIKIFICALRCLQDFWLVISISKWKAYFYTSPVIAGRCQYGFILYYTEVWSGEVYDSYCASQGTCTLRGGAGQADLLKKYWEPERILVTHIDGKYTHSYYKCLELVEYAANIWYSPVVLITVGADLRPICTLLDRAELSQAPLFPPSSSSSQHLYNNSACHKYCCEVARKYQSHTQWYTSAWVYRKWLQIK